MNQTRLLLLNIVASAYGGSRFCSSLSKCVVPGQCLVLLGVLCAVVVPSMSQKINRLELVSRHNVKINKIDSLSSLSVGNGNFAFTVDATGMQSFPYAYANGVPLGTQSVWGWHSFPNRENLRIE